MIYMTYMKGIYRCRAGVPWLPSATAATLCMSSRPVQGYLAHKKTPSSRPVQGNLARRVQGCLAHKKTAPWLLSARAAMLRMSSRPV